MSNDVKFYVGGGDFQGIIENGYYYVDKTPYLQEIFMGNLSVKANFFIRPHLFGKSLNMSMIKAFCKLNYANPGDKSYQEKLFIDNGRNLAVANASYSELRAKFMGEFPVIFISFRGIEGSSYRKALRSFILTITSVYRDFYFLKDSTKINSYDIEAFIDEFSFCRNVYKNIDQDNFEDKAESIICNFISNIASMLYQEYGRSVLVIIDDFHIPLQKAVEAKEPYSDKMLDIIHQISIRNFKQECAPWLFKGIVTGCLKIGHKSIFTGANNFVTYDMGDNPYAGFFGFTHEETHKILDDYGISSQEQILKEWYDGYRIGDEYIYCPWSILRFSNFAQEAQCKVKHPSYCEVKPQSYWANAIGHDVIKLYLQRAIRDDLSDDIRILEKLLNNEPQEITLQEFDTYPDINQELDIETFLTLLLQTGYLTFTDSSLLHDKVCLKISNFEVQRCLERIIEQLYTRSNPVWMQKARQLLLHLLANESDEVGYSINALLGDFIYLRNTGHEFSYHEFLYKILSLVASVEKVSLTLESEDNDAYSNITIYQPSSKIGVILEVRTANNTDEARITASLIATNHILNPKNLEKFRYKTYLKIYGFGLGCGGKACKITSLGNVMSQSGN